jgi:hypothetical protein
VRGQVPAEFEWTHEGFSLKAISSGDSLQPASVRTIRYQGQI